jgi:hypothetical protein
VKDEVFGDERWIEVRPPDGSVLLADGTRFALGQSS